MAKRGLRRKRTMRRSRKMHGGQSSVAANAGPVDSGNSYVLSQYGDGNTQWDNVFGPQSTSVMGNEIVNLQHPQQVPAMLYPMKGGKRRTRKMRRRGGQLITAASATPFALWGMQNMYSKKMKSRRGKKSRIGRK
jgi:hypothetical protein